MTALRKPRGVRVGLALDAVAVVLLLLSALAMIRDDFAIAAWLAVPSVLLAFAGSITGGVAFAVRFTGARLVAVVAGVVVLSALIIPVGLVALLLAADARPNPAAVAAEPLDRFVAEAGGRQVCAGGDPGRGLDNNRPEAFSSYVVPADQGRLRDQILAEARRRHFDTPTARDSVYSHTTHPQVSVLIDNRITCSDQPVTPAPAGQQVLTVVVSYSSTYWEDRSNPLFE